MVKVSVLIAAYNSEKWLSETLDSILNQTFKDFEIIVINDGSTDKTLEIAKRYSNKDERVKVLSKENGGKATALNFGLTIIKGIYISIIDSDDLMPDYVLKSGVDYLDSHSEIDLVYGDFEKFSEDGCKETIKTAEFDYPEQALESLKKNRGNLGLGEVSPHVLYNTKPEERRTIPSGGVLFRRAIIDSGIKFDENLRNIEDNDFWIHIIGKGFKPKRIPEIWMNYRVHNTQKSGNKEKMLIATRYINQKLKDGAYFK